MLRLRVVNQNDIERGRRKRFRPKSKRLSFLPARRLVANVRPVLSGFQVLSPAVLQANEIRDVPGELVARSRQQFHHFVRPERNEGTRHGHWCEGAVRAIQGDLPNLSSSVFVGSEPKWVRRSIRENDRQQNRFAQDPSGGLQLKLQLCCLVAWTEGVRQEGDSEECKQRKDRVTHKGMVVRRQALFLCRAQIPFPVRTLNRVAN